MWISKHFTSINPLGSKYNFSDCPGTGAPCRLAILTHYLPGHGGTSVNDPFVKTYLLNTCHVLDTGAGMGKQGDSL